MISRFCIWFPGTGDNIGERIEQIISVRNENVEEHWGFREVSPIGGNHGLVPSDFSVMHTEGWLWVGGRTGGGGTGPWGDERK